MLLRLVATMALLCASACASLPRTFSGPSSTPVLWDTGAVRPWPGLDCVIEQVSGVLREHYPNEPAILNYEVEAVPFAGFAVSPFEPSGTIEAADGEHKVTGTVRDDSALGLGIGIRWVAVVRQLHDATGALEPATVSALAHEVAEHLVPFVLHADWNPGHAPQWHALTAEIEARYARCAGAP